MYEPKPEPIAVVGIGCRFPGDCSSPSKLWDLLKEPRDVSQDIPRDRFNLKRFYHPYGPHHGTSNVERSYFLSEDVTHFDSQFFGIPPAEAEAIDPQHRFLLEVVYEAIQSAGMTFEGLYGSDTATYVGMMCNDYYVLQSQDLKILSTYNATGIADSNASSRISYCFNWHGPSLTIDTACSSSLIAVHEAVQALRSGASRVAVAAGTNLILCPLPYVSESNLQMLSPGGRSRMWDADADGYARGEGVAAVVLKTLNSALRDGDEIECIIRETATNHDGKTRGITMPSAIAQAELIRSTYAGAGLDITNERDQCQFFEAHGTGTPAGDPQEAEALSRAFFPDESEESNKSNNLFVGSIKTVVGHTEGTAGVAGLIKACLAVKHGVIPPNLLFNRLNPAIEPFYRRLHIPTSPQPWPNVPDGCPRRASVNSFGFGGSNAHVIVESYAKPLHLSHKSDSATLDTGNEASLIPFVFSATSENSLTATLQTYVSHLQENPDVDLRSLAHTLSTKTSTFPVRITISATTNQQLCKRIEDRLQEPSLAVAAPAFSTQSPSILGIFTGQGAQWATMGVGLISKSAKAWDTMQSLDRSLATLPAHYRPRWSLFRELLADSDSRISEAEISQPLCTAVQVVLVDLLLTAGIEFAAVVGHSSGEIAAAYAAGFIRASDAIRIAYLRGLFSKNAQGKDGKKGAMMAVSTSLKDARELCDLEDFRGRLCVAAHNAVDSVTLSGDEDAIQHAKQIFEDESKFVRILKVDTAYHSHHMAASSPAYLEALQACRIEILQPKPQAPKWFSSVHNGALVDTGPELKAQYWVDNMKQTVLFASSLEACFGNISDRELNFVLEVGPHPALRGPATNTIKTLAKAEPLYSGTLNRGVNDIEAFASAIGSIWTVFGKQAVNFEKFENACYSDMEAVRFLKDLPGYAWNHNRSLWVESRSTKRFRTQDGVFHDLLGILTPDGTSEEWRWQNVLLPTEIPWLAGHALQGQVVLPGTGYISLAMEAGLQIAGDRPVEMIELYDLEILRAISIHDTVGTELLVTMTSISTSKPDDKEIITANFSTFSTVGKDSSSLVLNTRGHVRITIGDTSSEIFPPRKSPQVDLTPVDIDRFYSAMRDDLGYMYEGRFRALTSLKRRLGQSSGTIANPPTEKGDTTLLFHPGMLDNALQGLFAAYSSPGDSRLWSMHAPTSCKRVTLIPSLCGEKMTPEVSFDCTLIDHPDNLITGDVDVYLGNGGGKAIEFEGLSFSPFATATEKDDRYLFSECVEYLDEPDGPVAFSDPLITPQQRQKATDAERAAFYFLKRLHFSVDKTQYSELPWYRQSLLDNAERVVELVQQGGVPHAPPSWLDDTEEEIYALMDSYGDQDADFNITRAVGENLLTPSVLRGDVNILEYMTKDNYLEKYYTDAVSFGWQNDAISGITEQVLNKYPNMNICEIGAGTGGATGAIIDKIGAGFSSYTYTDISSRFFEKAQSRFSQYGDRMHYKTLDIEKDVVEQGFKAYSYDLVIASIVLHATKSLEETLRNTRRLLKPGGFLVMLELIGNDIFRIGMVMGGLSGWWIGKDDGRRYSPTATLEEWDAVLKRTGFSGIDTFTPMVDKLLIPGSAILTQAVDDNINRLRQPLDFSPSPMTVADNLIIVGGEKETIFQLVEILNPILQPFFNNITTFKSFEEISSIPSDAYALCLADCDSPVFKNINEQGWEKFKNFIAPLRGLLWVTTGSRLEEPYAGITLGLFRSLWFEAQQTQLQLLDIDSVENLEPKRLSSLLLRLQTYTSLPEEKKGQLIWTMEPELILRKEKLFVVRIRPHKERNDRYNSLRRSITRNADIGSGTFNIEWSRRAYRLREQHLHTANYPEGYVSVQVECSLLSSLCTPVGYLFVSLGTNIQTGRKTLCFSTTNSSVLVVPKAIAVPVGDDHVVDMQYMSFVVAELISQQVLRIMPPTGTLLIHEADPGLVSFLSRKVVNKERKVVFTTSNIKYENKRNWIYLHERSASRLIKAAIPQDVSKILDLSPNSDAGDGLGSKIAASRAQVCDRLSASFLTHKEASTIPTEPPEILTQLLERANAFATSQLNAIPDGAPLTILSLREVIASQSSIHPMTLVRWRQDNSVPVLVEPVTERQDLFRDDRTYWLAGLTGDMGQSLADFMIQQGARYIALSSRSPKPDHSWVKARQAQGASIEYFACDLIDLQSVKSTYENIQNSMPPISGVANGALLLRDTLISTMPFEAYQTVVQPKVNGTNNLDSIFSSNTLDWFIAFSSLIATTGNPGQAAYSAANCFMKTLINHRRSRGLAGSVIDISRVLGVGYVEREMGAEGILTKEQTDRIMNRSGTLAMSEPDLHQLFAEAVVSGRPCTPPGSEIISGIYPISAEQARMTPWATNPKFGHLLRQETTSTTATADSGALARMPVKSQLQGANSIDEVTNILLNAMTTKLKASLFLSPTEPVSISMPLIDLGVDSLVGVDMRTWLLKELSIDIPVLKILGGASTTEIVEDIKERLHLPELVKVNGVT